MAKAIIDTNLMIRIIRGEQRVIRWFNTVEETIIFPCFVVMELVVGCNTKAELDDIERRIRPKSVYWPQELDIRKALEIVKANYRFGRKMGVIDALIAACAMSLHVKLYTEDKDFTNIPGLKRYAPIILP